MRTRALVAVACFAAAPAARASGPLALELEATFGVRQLGLTRVPGTSLPLSTGSRLGGTALLVTGSLAMGVAAEGDVSSATNRTLDLSALAGVALHLLPSFLRLEVLGEAGVSRVPPLDQGVTALRGSPSWERFYGFRPGLSVKVPALPFRFGVWGLARWRNRSGLGPAYGMLGRVGFEF